MNNHQWSNYGTSPQSSFGTDVSPVPGKFGEMGYIVCTKCGKFITEDGIIKNGMSYCNIHCATMDALGKEK
jgi:hypothetical protein